MWIEKQTKLLHFESDDPIILSISLSLVLKDFEQSFKYNQNLIDKK